MLRIQLDHREYSGKKKIKRDQKGQTQGFFITKTKRGIQNHATQEIHLTEKTLANSHMVLLNAEIKHSLQSFHN